MLLTLLQSGGVPAGVTASGAITLDAVDIDGVGTSTVQAFTGEWIGPVFFDQPIYLDGVVVAGAGTSTVQATGAVTLDTVVVAGSGTSTITSTGTVALGAVVVSGAGSPVVQATGNVTLSAVTIAGSGSGIVQGSGGLALGEVSVTGSGSPKSTASGSLTLEAVLFVGSGTVVSSTVSATAAISLSSIVTESEVTVARLAYPALRRTVGESIVYASARTTDSYPAGRTFQQSADNRFVLATAATRSDTLESATRTTTV